MIKPIKDYIIKLNKNSITNSVKLCRIKKYIYVLSITSRTGIYLLYGTQRKIHDGNKACL